MEFWGVEVKAGEPLKVPVDDECVVHLSQLWVSQKKRSEPAVIFVEFDSKKYVLGTLSRESIPQISLDVVFEKEFALSHNWKNGSVYFCGYKANQGPPEESDDEFSDEDSLDEDLDVPVQPFINGKADVKAKEVKPAAKGNASQVEVPGKKVKISDQKVEDEDSDDDDDDDLSELESDGDESGDSDKDMVNADDASDDDSDEEEEEPQPKGKKRSIPVQQKTPVPAKKSKQSTPQNTDAKKVAHTATPHPAKKAGKATASGDQTPKSSGGQFSCKSCKKGFGSESGLEQHTKAKHSS